MTGGDNDPRAGGNARRGVEQQHRPRREGARVLFRQSEHDQPRQVLAQMPDDVTRSRIGHRPAATARAVYELRPESTRFPRAITPSGLLRDHRQRQHVLRRGEHLRLQRRQRLQPDGPTRFPCTIRPPTEHHRRGRHQSLLRRGRQRPRPWTETGWYGSGGGASSSKIARPAWQTGAGVPTGTTRLVPDVSLVGFGFDLRLVLIHRCRRHSPTGIAGTSWSSPTWAGFSALINQARALQGRLPLGLLNRDVYPLIGTNNFYDVTTGNNSPAGTGNPGHGQFTPPEWATTR